MCHCYCFMQRCYWRPIYFNFFFFFFSVNWLCGLPLKANPSLHLIDGNLVLFQSRQWTLQKAFSRWTWSVVCLKMMQQWIFSKEIRIIIIIIITVEVYQLHCFQRNPVNLIHCDSTTSHLCQQSIRKIISEPLIVKTREVYWPPFEDSRTGFAGILLASCCCNPIHECPLQAPVIINMQCRMKIPL